MFIIHKKASSRQQRSFALILSQILFLKVAVKRIAANHIHFIDQAENMLTWEGQFPDREEPEFGREARQDLFQV